MASAHIALAHLQHLVAAPAGFISSSYSRHVSILPRSSPASAVGQKPLDPFYVALVHQAVFTQASLLFGGFMSICGIPPLSCVAGSVCGVGPHATINSNSIAKIITFFI